MKHQFSFIVTLTLITIVNINCEEIVYRCGVGKEYIEEIPISLEEEIEENDPLYKRRAESETEEFIDFHIYLDVINLKNHIQKFGLQKYEDLYIDSMKNAVKTLESLLKVKGPRKGFQFSDEQIRYAHVDDWNKTMFGTNATGNMYTYGIDLIIFARLRDDMNEGTLATAGSIYSDSKTGRPVFGIVNISTTVNYSKLNSNHAFQTTILHEFTHVLGFSGYHFRNQFHNVFERTDEDGVVRQYINSSKVLEVARKYYNCPSIDGVELEESGGDGTAGSHWESRILLGDYMNGVTYYDEEVISEFTLALLEDTTFYKANYYTGGLMRYGKGKGCDFVMKKCVNSGEINPKFENEFFDTLLAERFDSSCSSGRQSRTYQFLLESDNIPSYYKYFPSNEKLGGRPSADYCPVPRGLDNERVNDQYVGSCSSMGNGDYGTFIYYQYKYRETINGTNYIVTSYYYNKSGDLADMLGETFSDQSFCYQSTLIKEGINFNNTIPRATCFESFCSNRSLTIKVNSDYFVCPRAGGKIVVNGYKGYFLCADYNLICSGTVMCNDLFDCVEKKSETKEETYYYDYDILTSQNLVDAEINEPNNTNNYELSDNGICPKDCKQCQINRICSQCRENYNLVGEKGIEEIICLPQSELNIGYYQENSIYYKCISNCDICKSGESCEQCSSGFEVVNGKCIKQTENCESYDNEGICSKCADNFAFEEDNRTICIDKTNFENYYTKDNGISYHSCEKEIKNCLKCYYNEEQSKGKCYLCNTNFVLLETVDNNLCLDESVLNKTFYKINSTHIDKCSNAINNCNECDDENTCLKCENDFYMVNDDNKSCINASNIQMDEYYLQDGTTMLYSCQNSSYNDIENCKKCSEKKSCNFCKDDFTFIDGDKSNCVRIESLNNKYIKDPNDTTNYIQCHNIYENCDTCNDKNCLTCNDGYELINDGCIAKSSLQTYSTTNIPTINTLTTSPTNAPTSLINIASTSTQTITPTNNPTITSTNIPTNIPTSTSTNAPSSSPTINPTGTTINPLTNKPTSYFSNQYNLKDFFLYFKFIMSIKGYFRNVIT